jgi:phage anti-repressor protein
MLDEKVRLENEMKLNQETLDKVKVSVRDNDADLIKFKSLHDLLETKKERFTKYVDDINIENNDYIKINAELELENEIIEKKIQMVLKKIDVNNLLKEVNVDDLALASKKNQIVNNVLMDLMNKWEQVNIQY